MIMGKCDLLSTTDTSLDHRRFAFSFLNEKHGRFASSFLLNESNKA